MVVSKGNDDFRSFVGGVRKSYNGKDIESSENTMDVILELIGSVIVDGIRWALKEIACEVIKQLVVSKNI